MARFSNISGRYVYLTVDDVEYRVYIEEAGQGIPVVLQHTAGSDGRQWRHLLEDPDITSNFHLIAADLPYHGKSLPPTSVRYWEVEYKLRKDWFMRYWVTLCHELELDRPVYMGCSMGGHLAGDLALHYPNEFRAVIGLEAAMHSHGMDRLLDWWWHPRMSNESKSSMMHSLCAPQSPEEYRRETIWMYSQGAPVVFKGDLNYYSHEHDLTDTAKDIDTSKVDVYILSADYDWSAYPEWSQAMANEIKGSHYQLMKGMGHFPMSENPAAFKQYIMPVLKEIQRKSV